MKKSAIIDGNKLILQSQYHGTEYTYREGLNDKFYLEVLQFHKDYNLLMSIYDNIKAEHNEAHSGIYDTSHVSISMSDEIANICNITHTFRKRSQQISRHHSAPCDTMTISSGPCKSMREALYTAIIKTIVYFQLR